MSTQEYKVLITVSGLGSRLGDLTKYINKSLIKVGKKPAISYIIESYPKETQFVITLGHMGNVVKQFLELVYSDRFFEFVYVDKYEGTGSSLLYSINCAKENLQCPFIFHACDTITDDIKFSGNCLYLSKSFENINEYRTVNIDKNIILEKSNHANSYPYIGVCSINDYKSFWKSLQVTLNGEFEQSDCSVINAMLNSGIKFDYKFVEKWFDVGNLESLNRARKNIEDRFDILDKLQESIYIFKDFVVKYFYDKNLIKNRVDRTKSLNGTVPDIIGQTENFYKYSFVFGDEYSHIVNDDNFLELLSFTNNKLWKIKGPNIKNECLKFYKNKTNDRLKEYFSRFNLQDTSYEINGIIVPSTKELLSNINFEEFCDIESSKFHGDFILENIIKGEYIALIDWRQDFGGCLEYGDLYYDLAKMNHNLIIDHSIVYRNLFTLNNTDSGVDIDIHVSFKNISLKQVFDKFLNENNYDKNRVEILTGLIWLNMSPLHDDNFSKFIFNMGKLKLYRSLYGK